MPMIHRVNTTADANATTRVGSGASVVDTGLARVLRAPASWLVLLVGFSTLLRAGFAARVPTPWILPDELVYSELAKSIASGHRPAVRGVPVFGWGEIYPTLIAPAWALIDDPVRAYHAALIVSAFVMSLAAVPAYLLARLFVSKRISFLVAVMTVLVPSMAYTGVVMTENAFYPVFLLAVFLDHPDGADSLLQDVRRCPCSASASSRSRGSRVSRSSAHTCLRSHLRADGASRGHGEIPQAIHSHGGVTSRRSPSAGRRLGRTWRRSVRLARRALVTFAGFHAARGTRVVRLPRRRPHPLRCPRSARAASAIVVRTG